MQTTAQPNNDIVTLHLVTDACTETLPHWDRSKHKQVYLSELGLRSALGMSPGGRMEVPSHHYTTHLKLR